MTLAIETDLDHLRRLADALNGSPVPNLHMTEQEFSDWCPDELRAEWVNGEVFLMAPGNIDHEDINHWLITITLTFVQSRNLGRVLGNNFFVKLTRQLRLPDLVFVKNERTHLIKHTRMEGAPDLVMEIVSPESRNRDRREKFEKYQSDGVPEYWIIDPLTRTIDLYELVNGRYEEITPVDGKYQSKVLPGYYLRLEWLMSHQPPSPISVFREFGLL